MPSEYEALVAALKLTDIPFAEYGWDRKPDGAYGVVTLDMESGGLNADNEKSDRAWEASVDVFFPRLNQRADIVATVEEVLEEICGSAWYLNSNQHETNPSMIHMEWVCEVLNTGAV